MPTPKSDEHATAKPTTLFLAQYRALSASAVVWTDVGPVFEEPAEAFVQLKHLVPAGVLCRVVAIQASELL